MKHITSVTVGSPKRKGRMESIHWYVLFVLMLVGGMFLLLGFLDAYAVRKQEALFNDRQYLQTTTARLVVEDRVSAARTRMRFLLDSLCIDTQSPSRIVEVQRSLQSAIYNSSDILGFAFIPHPHQKNFSAFESFRSTPAGDSAKEFVRSLEERFDFSSLRPPDLYPFSGTVRASSRNSMMAVVEPFAEEGRFLGYFISILDLAPLLVRYIQPMSRGRGSASFLIGSDGTVIDHKERSLIGRNAASFSDGEGALVREAWNTMRRSLSGMESFAAPASASDGDRRLLAWNSVRTGAERLYVGVYSSESEINPALDELRMQRNLLGGGLVLVILMGTAIFLRRKESSELRRSEAAFRSIFNSAASGIAILDANGAILSCNTTLETMTGRSSTNLKFFTLFDLAASSSPEEKEKVRRSLAEGVRSARAELLFSRKGVSEERSGEALSDEQTFWADVSLNRLEEAVGEAPGRMLAMVTDISGCKRAEELLRQNAGLLEARKEELEQVASGQSALLKMFTFFSECGTTEELFKVLTEHLFPVIPFRSLTLFLKRSREARSFNVLDSSGDVPRSGQSSFLEERKGVMGQVAGTGKAYLVGNAESDPYFIPHSPTVRSAVVAPVIYKQFLWGLSLSTARRSSPSAFGRGIF